MQVGIKYLESQVVPPTFPCCLPADGLQPPDDAKAQNFFTCAAEVELSPHAENL